MPKADRLLQNILSNRCFKIVLGEKVSDTKIINNDLLQGSVPFFFNLYVSDLPKIEAEKFYYADDIKLVTRHRSLNIIETIQSNGLAILQTYFSK